MTRRQAYSKLKKNNQVRAKHVKGSGQKVYKGFQCLNAECTNFIFVKEDDFLSSGCECTSCDYVFDVDGEEKFFDYNMEVEDEVVSTGEFIIRHDEYIEEALDYKYCIICNTMKPLEFFSVHNELSSGRQGECRMCKIKYNSIKNSTRISEQFKESSQKRRMYSILAGKEKINLDAIFTKFKGKCFNCSEPLTKGEENLDHTLPLYYLYPLSNDNATLLCKGCNLEKAEKWPGLFYKQEEKLKKLSFLTGIEYKILAGEPIYNPDALEQIQDNDVMDEILSKYIKYIKDIIKLRNRILFNTGVDLFEGTQISRKLLDDANDKYSKKYER